MTKLPVLLGLFFLQGAAACGPRETAVTREKPNPHFQVRITGVGLSNLRSTVRSKGQQQAWMFDGPVQDMFFQKSDTIQHLFVLGKTDSTEQFDSTAIGWNEVLNFTLRIARNKELKPVPPNPKTLFLVELLANGQVVQSAQVPAQVASTKQSAASDSVATLTFNTNTL